MINGCARPLARVMLEGASQDDDFPTEIFSNGQSGFAFSSVDDRIAARTLILFSVEWDKPMRDIRPKVQLVPVGTLPCGFVTGRALTAWNRRKGRMEPVEGGPLMGDVHPTLPAKVTVLRAVARPGVAAVAYIHDELGYVGLAVKVPRCPTQQYCLELLPFAADYAKRLCVMTPRRVVAYGSPRFPYAYVLDLSIDSTVAWQWPGCTGPLRHVSYFPSRDVLVAVSANGPPLLTVISASTGEVLQTVSPCWLREDDVVLATGGTDGLVVLYQTACGDMEMQILALA